MVQLDDKKDADGPTKLKPFSFFSPDYAIVRFLGIVESCTLFWLCYTAKASLHVCCISASGPLQY